MSQKEVVSEEFPHAGTSMQEGQSLLAANDDESPKQTFLSAVQFDFDSSELTGKARMKLLAKMADLQKQGVSSVSVFGFTDNVGAEAYNKNLAKDRASTVARFLANGGVQINEVVGKPLCCYLVDNESDQNRHVNRRAEIHLGN
ncbi:OmpA family protein [Oceanobacter sp. RED65]|uniref:OmpA family protein n=2 Tax=Bermanella marisrubri TaxID=207949 RepID=Q1MXI5_9GAMM|nr:OmpA family protein [Oceanobacter sp. RED65] [Bermanella marisrubri]